MARKKSLVRKLLNPWRILIPVILGLGVSEYLIAQELSVTPLASFNWSGRIIGFLLLAIAMMMVRDVAYIIRIKLLSDGDLSWRQAIQVILLWEFSSAITPSVVGGAPIAVMLLHKEGLSLGKSTAMVLLTALLDELFFLAMVPILYCSVDLVDLFPLQEFSFKGATLQAETGLWISYFLITGYCLFILLALFIAPEKVNRQFLSLSRHRWFTKWSDSIAKFANDLKNSSLTFKGRSFWFWLKALASTFLSWTGRYMVINSLITAVTVGPDQMLIYARQLVMWVILLISVTPGGSGFAEAVFGPFFQDMIPEGLTSSVAITWRLISYWIYVLIGLILLPKWLRRVYLKRRLITFKSPSKSA